MQIMSLKQWHSNGRKGKIITRTCIKIKTGNQENIQKNNNIFKSKRTTYNKRRATKIVADWELKVVVPTTELLCVCLSNNLYQYVAHGLDQQRRTHRPRQVLRLWQ